MPYHHRIKVSDPPRLPLRPLFPHDILFDSRSCLFDPETSESGFCGPEKQKHERPMDSSKLIRAQPWFKIVTSWHLWNVPFIDVVLISSPMGMPGLPFLSRVNGFRAKIYVTEVIARIARLMMIGRKQVLDVAGSSSGGYNELCR